MFNFGPAFLRLSGHQNPRSPKLLVVFQRPYRQFLRSDHHIGITNYLVACLRSQASFHPSAPTLWLCCCLCQHSTADPCITWASYPTSPASCVYTSNKEQNVNYHSCQGPQLRAPLLKFLGVQKGSSTICHVTYILFWAEGLTLAIVDWPPPGVLWLTLS